MRCQMYTCDKTAHPVHIFCERHGGNDWITTVRARALNIALTLSRPPRMNEDEPAVSLNTVNRWLDGIIAELNALSTKVRGY